MLKLSKLKDKLLSLTEKVENLYLAWAKPTVHDDRVLGQVNDFIKLREEFGWTFKEVKRFDPVEKVNRTEALRCKMLPYLSFDVTYTTFTKLKEKPDAYVPTFTYPHTLDETSAITYLAMQIDQLNKCKYTWYYPDGFEQIKCLIGIHKDEIVIIKQV